MIAGFEILDIIRAVVQIAFLSVFFYYSYIILFENQAGQILKPSFTYLIIYFVSIIFSLNILRKILTLGAVPFVVFMFILYHPELRRAFASGFIKKGKLFRIGNAQTTSEQIDSIILACEQLVKTKRGALFVFPRSLQLNNIIDTGTRLNAEISTALIVTVFDHDTPLHDGAMIIVGSKILAAGCYLPLSTQTAIKQSFGTRHRAGLGMSEESDAIVLIVSEESGAISIAYNGVMYYALDPKRIKRILMASFTNQDIQFDIELKGDEEDE